MKIAHVHDVLETLAPRTGDPLDVGSEWEDERTIAGQIEGLCACGHTVVRVPFEQGFAACLMAEKHDCVFNISEGRTGRDRESIVPAVCQALDIPCTSSDAVGMGVTLNKAMCKAVARAARVVTPDWLLWRDASEIRRPPFGFPVFVKPNFEGSSMGIRPQSLVADMQALFEQASWVLTNIGPVLVEQAMPGPELTVALLGNEHPEIFPIAEIRTAGRIYDKSMKSKDRMEEEVICPAEIPGDIAERLVDDSLRLFTELGLAGAVRMDFKCDADGLPQFLEANPLPGLSRYYSVYTIQARAAGIGYDELMGRLVDLALARHSRGF
jgi:D-alanine-D-alanine ligase